MIFTGDVLDKMAEIPDESVQTCVTSPPYWGLRDYGVSGQIGLESTPEEYVEKMVAVFREVRRVLRKDGTCWINLGDTYTSGGCKSRDPGVDGLHPDTPSRLKPKDLVGIPWRVAFALQADGWCLRQDIIWQKPNPIPESTKDRCTKAHEYVFLLSKSERYFYDCDAIREPCVTNYPTKISRPAGWAEGPGSHTAVDHARAKSHRGSKFHKGKTAEHQLNRASEIEREDHPLGRNKRSVWTISTQPYSGAHFAVFPEALVETCIRAGSRPGDVVLDPFAGSGTTLAVAERLGRNHIGIELNPEYVGMILRRLESVAPPLFPEAV